MQTRICVFTAVFLVTICFVGNSLAADVAKIGILDQQSVLQKSSAGKAAQAHIKKEFNDRENELKKRGSEIQELEKQLKREAMVMSQEKRDDKSRELKIKKVELDDLGKQYTRELKQLELKLINRIQKDIANLTIEIGKKEGYLLIINKPAVLYNPTSIDVTDQIIQAYNAKFAKGETEASKKD